MIEIEDAMNIPNIYFDCARTSTTGSLDVLRAEKYLEADEWGRAVRAVKKALKHIEADGNAYWILGHAHLKQGQVKLARSAFEQAADFREYRVRAQYWLDTLRQNQDAY